MVLAQDFKRTLDSVWRERWKSQRAILEERNRNLSDSNDDLREIVEREAFRRTKDALYDWAAIAPTDPGVFATLYVEAWFETLFDVLREARDGSIALPKKGEVRAYLRTLYPAPHTLEITYTLVDDTYNWRVAEEALAKGDLQTAESLYEKHDGFWDILGEFGGA